jgi:uncharacterized protein (TIGR00369 family)
MPSNSIFWKIERGDMAMPNIAITLNAQTISYDESAKTLSAAFEVGERFLNPVGHIQGGILTAMLDAVMGPCNGMVLSDNQFAPTLNINVFFINPASPGRFIGKAKVNYQGHSICFLSGELFDQHQTLIATATATAKVVNFKD